MTFHDRKHPAHFPARERHNTPVIVFLTVCTKRRRPILANADVHDLLIESWRVAGSWLVCRYVIMPDHVHLFCGPADMNHEPPQHWVRYWKSHSSRRWPRREEAPVWQRHFWDTQLRRGENYDAKWEYVLANPVRAGLVTNPQDWPFQGELNVLQW